MAFLSTDASMARRWRSKITLHSIARILFIAALSVATLGVVFYLVMLIPLIISASQNEPDAKSLLGVLIAIGVVGLIICAPVLSLLWLLFKKTK